MSTNFNEILASADWKGLTRRLLYFADNLIRQCVWNGTAVTPKPGAKVCVEGFGADDLVNEAVDRFLNGRRTYNFEVPLEQNLRGCIRSIVSSLNKSAQRRPMLVTAATQPSEEMADPIDMIEGPIKSPDCSAVAKEEMDRRNRLLAQFERSLAADRDLVRVFGAFKKGKTKPREIETMTGIPASRASELKRKLRGRMEQFQIQAVKHVQ